MLEGPRGAELWEGSRGVPGGLRAGLGGEGVSQPNNQDCSEHQGEGASRKRRAEPPGQRPPRPASRSRPRSSSRTADWLPHGSPHRPEDRSAGPLGDRSSSSSEDEGEGRPEPGSEPGGRGRSRAKPPPSKKHNGLKEKTKGGRSSAFWEVPEKRPKLALSAEERPAGGRGKGQKDVWSSIQAQWPKKTLKELFSDSDTEAANSPPPALAQAEDPRAGSPGREGPAGRSTPDPQDPRPPPSSGSNSVLHTPPTTPESPAANPTPAPPAPSFPGPPASGPPPEESPGGRSETDSSTVEVESLGGELHPEDRAGPLSMAFEGSLSCHSSCSSPQAGEPQARPTGGSAAPAESRAFPWKYRVIPHSQQGNCYIFRLCGLFFCMI